MYSCMNQTAEIVETIRIEAACLLLQRRRVDEVVGLKAFRVAHDLVQACTLDGVADLLDLFGRELHTRRADVLFDALPSSISCPRAGL